MKDKINAVDMMRSIREQLQKSYENDPSLRKKHLAEIRNKYKIKTKDKESL
jgi:hypothetical protein